LKILQGNKVGRQLTSFKLYSTFLNHHLSFNWVLLYHTILTQPERKILVSKFEFGGTFGMSVEEVYRELEAFHF
jgi:hypothetical protein